MWATTDSAGPGGIVGANGLWPPPSLSQFTSNGLAFSGVASWMQTCLCTYVCKHLWASTLGEAQPAPSIRRGKLWNL